MYLGMTRPIQKEKNQKYLFQRSFYVILINIGWYFMLLKTQNSDIKIPGLRQNNSKSTKKLKKREKNVFLHTAKCLKAKKSYCVFHTPKNNVLVCILALITSLLKSKEQCPKFQKQQKFYFVFLLVFGVRHYT